MFKKFNNPYRQGRLAVERNKLESFLDGYVAFENKLEVDDNPHEPKTLLWKQWDRGWREAQKDSIENLKKDN